MTSVPESLAPFLADPAITDLCFNGHQDFWMDQGHGFMPYSGQPHFATETDYRQFVLENLSLSGKTWDAKLPFVDTLFFETHRAHLAFPPVSRAGIILSLRRLPTRYPNHHHPESDPISARWHQSSAALELLKSSTLNHESILLCGATGSGKTTLFNDLLSFVSKTERLIALEDTSEISPSHPHFLSLLSRTANADGFGEVTLRDLLKQTLRMRPDRILIGECRGNEVLDLLMALNTGHRGTLATLHSNSAQDALKRLELLGLIASGGSIPSALIRSLISNGIQKIAHLGRINGVRMIEEVISIEGFERDVIYTRTLYSRKPSFAASRERLEIRKEV